MRVISKFLFLLIRYLVFFNKDRKKLFLIFLVVLYVIFIGRKNENNMIENIFNISMWLWKDVMGVGRFISIVVFMGCDFRGVRIGSDCY